MPSSAAPTPFRCWWSGLGSVRLRTTVAATLVVAVALTVGGAITLERFRSSLLNNRRDAALARAADLASLATSGRLPVVLGLPGQDASFAQVVGPDGKVLAASANIAGEPAVGPPERGRVRPVVRYVNRPVGQDGRYGLVAVTAEMGSSTVTIYAGYSLVTSDLAIGDVRQALLIGLPMLILLVGATAWTAVGRALQPIDAIRREVGEITTQDLHRRVPEPAGGDEVARLAKTMNSMLDRLETSLERQRAFVADASHELRSPLGSLRAQLEIGLAGGARTDWHAAATDALAEEERIERLVNDLLLLARLDAPTPPTGGQGPAGSHQADLRDIVDADLTARTRRPSEAADGLLDPVAFRAARGAGPALVAMDPGLARRVVTNLMDNAQRHARSEVTVSLSLPEPGSVELVVADDGPGIRPEDRERVFERFTRLDEARAVDDGGAGLGLAIVRDIVSRHGGTVGFTDAGVGARAVVRLPAALPAVAASPRTS